MDIMLAVARGLTAGLILGTVLGLFRQVRRSRMDAKVAERDARSAAWMKKLAPYVKLLTFVVLFAGLVWTVYFLVLGLVVPSQMDYANNASQLIVSALTVFSIIIAFYQFLKG